MNAIDRILATAVLAIPLTALAQVTPADQPRTELEKKQTTETGQAPKYGQSGTDTGGAMTKPDGKAKAKRKGLTKTEATTPVGELSTYPAPTRTGTPTSPTTK